jgi:hypothetical protein
MERLRKMLGEDVPVNLVFPDQEKKKVEKNVFWNDSATSMTVKDYEVIPRELSPVAVAGTVGPRSKTNGRITGARDSMGVFSPHRANRQEHQTLRKMNPNQHVKSNSLPSSSTSVQAITALPSPDKNISQKRLCVIVESPEEHGSSGLEGFGLGGCTTNTMMNGGRKFRMNEEEAVMNKLWSTRRGYTGWNRSMALGRISESPLSFLEDEKRSSMIGFRKSTNFVDF